MTTIRWGNIGTETVSPQAHVQTFVELLRDFRPRIAELSVARIVLEPFDGRFPHSAQPIIVECSEDEMGTLQQIANWYIQAHNNPVFATIKNSTEYSAGIPQSQLSAN